MLINIPLFKDLEKERLNYNDWVFLLSLRDNLELFPEDDEKVYGVIFQKLLIMGYCSLDTEESSKIFKITENGEDLINKLENQ